MKEGRLNMNPLTRPEDPLQTHPPIKFGDREIFDARNGLTKREHFASIAMQGILSSCELREVLIRQNSELSDMAVYMADNLIESLNKSR